MEVRSTKMLSLAASAVVALAFVGPAFAQIIQGANKEGELKLAVPTPSTTT